MNFIWAIAMLALSAFITALIMPKIQGPEAAAFEDFDFPQMDEGTPQSVVFGDVWSKDWFVLWYGNYRTTGIKPKKKGKK